MKKYRKIFWLVAAVAGCVALPTWFLLVVLENSYVGNPRVPHTEIGLVASYTMKGIQVYVTEWQRTLVTWLFRFDVGMFAIIVICVFLSRGQLDPRRPNSN